MRVGERVLVVVEKEEEEDGRRRVRRRRGIVFACVCLLGVQMLGTKTGKVRCIFESGG